MIALHGDGPIVLVDDSEDEQYVAKRVYNQSKCKRPLLLMDSGKALLTYLNEVKKRKKKMPALVLLDLNMPEMNGFEVLKAVRSQDGFSKILPLVIFTNSNNPDDKKKAFLLGATEYQVKPFGTGELVSFFNSLASESSPNFRE